MASAERAMRTGRPALNRTAAEMGRWAAQQHVRHPNLPTTHAYAKWRDRGKMREMAQQW